MILTDEMLMAAFRYRETHLWEWLDDSMVFAFVLSDGETGYCSVMGNACLTKKTGVIGLLLEMMFIISF